MGRSLRGLPRRFWATLVPTSPTQPEARSRLLESPDELSWIAPVRLNHVRRRTRVPMRKSDIVVVRIRSPVDMNVWQARYRHRLHKRVGCSSPDRNEPSEKITFDVIAAANVIV